MQNTHNRTKKAFAALRTYTRKIKTLFPSSHYALLSLLYIVGLEFMFALQKWLVLVSITVIAVITLGIFLVRYEEKGAFSLSDTILPLTAAIGLSGFTFFRPNNNLLHLYIILAGIVLFFLLKHGARKAYPTWNWLISLLVFFLNMAFIVGLRFHLYIPVILTLFLVFLMSGVISWQSMRRLASGPDIILPVLAMSFTLTELAWTMQFLPSHYLMQAGVLATAYYIMFNLIAISLQRKTTKKDILEYAAVGMTALAILITTARWA